MFIMQMNKCVNVPMDHLSSVGSGRSSVSSGSLVGGDGMPGWELMVIIVLRLGGLSGSHFGCSLLGLGAAGATGGLRASKDERIINYRFMK